MAVLGYITITFLAGLLLAFGVRYSATLPGWLRLSGALAIVLSFILELWFRPSLLALSNVNVLLVALVIGAVISLPLQTVSATNAFAITAAVVDVVSFSGGLTARLIATASWENDSLLQYLVIAWPVQDSVVAILGLGDLAVLTALYLALRRLGFRDLLAMVLPLSGLSIGILVGSTTGGVFGIPFMAASVVLGTWCIGRRGRSGSPSPK